MKRNLMVILTIFIVCTMVTPVLAGKGKGSGSRSQYSGGLKTGTGAMLQNQTRQQNQYRYQKNQSADASVNQTRRQLRTRDPLTHTAVSLPLQSIPGIDQ